MFVSNVSFKFSLFKRNNFSNNSFILFQLIAVNEFAILLLRGFQIKGNGNGPLNYFNSEGRFRKHKGTN